MLKLYIGNKNYSSWSMRPWVLLQQAGIAFEEVMVKFDDMADGSPFKVQMRQIAPTVRVPVLVDGDVVIWDSLAIAEYVAELYPHKNLWPANPQERARARAICAEMHAGFGALRNAFGMNIEATLPHIGQIVLRDQPAVRADLERIVDMWSQQLARHGNRFLFGDFSIADAYYAPVCMRLRTYAVPVPADIAAYVDRVSALPGVRAWTDAALLEHNFVVFDEPYRAAR